MKILPSTGQEWLRLIAAPFKAYIIGVAIVFPYWQNHVPVNQRFIGNGLLYEGLTYLSVGFFVSFVALALVAILQLIAKGRRAATWTFLFAFVAICAGVIMIPPNVR